MHARKKKPCFLRRRRAKAAVDNAIALLLPALGLLSGVAEQLNVPGLKAGVEGLASLLEMVKQTHSNIEDIEGLVSDINALSSAIDQVTQESKEMSPTMIHRFTRLAGSLRNIVDEAQQVKARHCFVRFWLSKSDAEKIQELIRRATTSITNNIFLGVIAIEVTLADHTRRVSNEFQGVRADLKNLLISDGLGTLPLAAKAPYDCGQERRGCLIGTRVVVLDWVERWIRHQLGSAPAGQAELPISGTGKLILWLNGLAGTGKTTIAYTLADWCKANGVLGASHFCSRSDSDCSDVSKIIPTIAYQLAFLYPGYKERLVAIIRNNPLVVNSAIPTQVRELLLAPLQDLRDQMNPSVIVIDALDECKDPEGASAVISTLLQYSEDLSPLRFIITSRPEVHLSIPFAKKEAHDATSSLPLHNIPLHQVAPDIRTFIIAALRGIRESGRWMGLLKWPTAKDIERLVELSQGLFIYAATVVRFIQDTTFRDPSGQLERLLSSQSSGSSLGIPDLDALYLEVFRTAFPNPPPNRLSWIPKIVFSSLVTLQEPLSCADLGHLLEISPDKVYNTLTGLHSVLTVPKEMTVPIQIVHATLPQFLVHADRCNDTAFFVDSAYYHTVLLRGCLRAIRDDLKQNICGIRNRTLPHSEAPEVYGNIDAAFPPFVGYACRHLAVHLEHADLTEASDQLLVQEFANSKLLHWLEACSLLGIFKEAVVGLRTCHLKLTADANLAETVNLLRECERFAAHFLPAVSVTCLALYDSTLVLTPPDSALRRAYEAEIQCSPLQMVRSGAAQTFERLLAEFRISDGSSDARTMVFSPDCSKFVSVDEENRVKLWDAMSHLLLLEFAGHAREQDGGMVEVKFSPDGLYVACLQGPVVHMWRVATGILERTIPVGFVKSFDFTLDGDHIISPSIQSGAAFNVWNITPYSTVLDYPRIQGACKHSVEMIATSPDGRWIASYSSEGDVLLWDMRFEFSRPRVLNLDGTPAVVMSNPLLQFTRDSRHILLWDQDRASHVAAWMITGSRAAPRVLDLGNNDLMLTAIFPCADSRIIVCRYPGLDADAADAVSVSSLHVETGEQTPMCHFKYAQASVQPMACSTDGTRILSADRYRLIQIWDTTPHAQYEPAADSTPTRIEYDRAVFSSSGAHMLSWSKDQPGSWDTWWTGSASTATLRIHDTATWRSREVLAENLLLPDGRSPSAILRHLLVERAYNSWWFLDHMPCSSTFPLLAPPASDGSVAPSPSPCLGGALPHTFQGYSGYSRTRKAVITLDGKRMITPRNTGVEHTELCDDGAIFVWELDTLALVRAFRGPRSNVTYISVSFNGTVLVSVTEYTTVQVWDLETGNLAWTVEPRAGEPRSESHLSRDVDAVVFSSTGDRIACRHNDAAITLLDAATGRQIWVTSPGDLNLVERSGYTFESVAFTPRSDIIISTEGSYACFWDAANGRLLRHIHRDTFPDVLRITPDGAGYIISNSSGEADLTVRLWTSLGELLDGVPADVAQWMGPGPSTERPAYLESRGWVYEMSPAGNRRMFWLPPELRPLVGYSPRKYLVFGNGQILDISHF